MQNDLDSTASARGRRRALPWLVALPFAVALIAGCAQASQSSDASPTTSAAAASGQLTVAPAPTSGDATTSSATPGGAGGGEDFVATEADFTHVKDMTAVREFFVDNRVGKLDEALAVAKSPTGGKYPVGTIIQLVPQEAMVKRRAGFDPKSNDWEFFELDVSATGTSIRQRGGSEVVSRISKSSCADCHKAAKPEFDFVCENDHGCEPLPIPDSVFLQLQAADPRPRANA